jgi:hypothetical protein
LPDYASSTQRLAAFIRIGKMLDTRINLTKNVKKIRFFRFLPAGIAFNAVFLFYNHVLRTF